MLVGNKSDLTAVNLDMNALREKYSNIIDFYAISCTSETSSFKRRYKLFRDELIEQLAAVGMHQVMFTPNQFKALDQIRQLSRENAFLPHDQFDGLCKKHEIGKVGLDQEDFLGVLDNLGEIVHFPDLQWSDAYVLNPRWLTYGVYALLYSDQANMQQGVLSHTDVIDILVAKKVEDENGNQLDYPKEKCRFIIDAMSKFKLCYCLPGDHGHFVIPDKLATEQPDLTNDFNKNADGTLVFEFGFTGLLPRNVMPNLIVARHQEIIKDHKNAQLVWQHGVIVHHGKYQSTACLQVDYHQRTLKLWIQGKSRREYLVVLRDEIYVILNAIKGLSVKENIMLPEFARINEERMIIDGKEVEKITYQSLIEQAKAGNKEVFSDAGNQYDLKKVIGFIMTDEQQKKEGVTYVTNNIENLGAMGGVGDNHNVHGKIVLTAADKQVVSELQQQLTALMQHVQNHNADFEIKSDAHAELKQIRTHLENLENASPETRGKLRQLFENIKDGSSGAIKLGKQIKEADETVTWLMGKAALLIKLLTVGP